MVVRPVYIFQPSYRRPSVMYVGLDERIQALELNLVVGVGG